MKTKLRDGWRRPAAGLFGLGVLLAASPAWSQPSQAQINAVRQNCRSDYMAHCSSVPPGGADSLNCLQNNGPRLSAACRGAVDALKPPATPAAAPAPAARPEPAAAPAAKPAPAPAQQRAATEPAQQPQRPQTAKPVPARQAPPPRTAAAPAAAAPAAAPAYTPMPPLRPRVQLAIIRVCDADRQAVCSMVPVGGGRVIDCLARNEAALTQACRDTLSAARASAGR